MQVPLRIVFRGMSPSESVEARIRERAELLEQFDAQLIGCRVVVEARHQHHHQGRLYHLRIELEVPGREIVISRDPSEHHAHEDVYVAIRDAFDEARRRLEDHVRRIRLDTKTHEGALHGCIVQMSPTEDYGFIRTGDDRDVYFHRNSVIEGDFDRIDIGDDVRFVLHEATEGLESGPHASSVRVTRKHRLEDTVVKSASSG